MLLAAVGSYVVDVATAVFVMVPVAVTVATIERVAPAPLARLPTAQAPLAYVPTDGVALTRVRPAGNASATDTACAALGPALATVTVKVTFWPTSGVGSLTVLVTARFASGTSTDADAALLPGA